MKILIVGPIDNAKGGIAEYIKNLTEYVEGYPELEYIKLNTNIIGGKVKKIIYIFKIVRKYINILKINNIDIVHINMATRGSLIRKSILLLIGKLKKKKVIIHIHSGEFISYYQQKGNLKLIKKILNMADEIIVLNNSMKNSFYEVLGMQTTVLINGIKTNEINTYSIKNKNIIFLGRLTKKKGIYDLIKAIKIIVKDKNIKYKFIIAGEGENEKVENIIADNKLKEYIKLTGWIDGKEKVNLIKNSALMVLPSYYEGVPISLLEAMNYGVPIIGSNIDGITAILENKVCGEIVEVGNIKDLANTIINLMENKEKRKKYSVNCREYVCNKLSMDKYIENLFCIYRVINE